MKKKFKLFELITPRIQGDHDVGFQFSVLFQIEITQNSKVESFRFHSFFSEKLGFLTKFVITTQKYRKQ